MSSQNQNLLALSAQIVAAHAGHNEVETHAIPNIIRSVYNTLADLHPYRTNGAADASHVRADHDHFGLELREHDHSQDDLETPDEEDDQNAYVHPTYGQTVFGDRLICMEDGMSMKMLKRHLITVHGMTPEEYRTKWGLPETYPMVATEYAKLRSSLALQSGLGLKPEDRVSKGRKKRRT